VKDLEDKITIYTDGAARGNPGRAGWAALLIFHPYPNPTSPLLMGRRKEGVVKRQIELGGFSPHATNNQMELTAPIEALKYCARQGLTQTIEIFSDSKYVILGITEWIFNWQKNNWCNAAKKPVLNKELWQELLTLTENFKIKWHYVEGHSGDKYNDRVDEIATSFADGNLLELKK